jgi:ribonuclease G
LIPGCIVSESLLINVAEYETRVAVMSDGLLQALYLERETSRSITGNIYIGRVVRILPGIQAAFVDFGEERPGFLHVNETLGAGDIQNILHEGQMLRVQVTKEQIGSKGARLTMHLSIASRYLVILIGSTHIGVSQKILEPMERDRLSGLMNDLREKLGLADSVGFIARTSAMSAEEGDIERDVEYLEQLWQSLVANDLSSQGPGMFYKEQALFMKIVRDLTRSETQTIKIDDANAYDRLHNYMKLQLPEYASKLVLEDPLKALFGTYDIEKDISAVMVRDVTLKSGGSIVIEQTEAMVTIDVNTGTFVGNRSLEETVYQTNVEAAREIPRQLRLRNLGGIIVIDFIDMEQSVHRLRVLEELEQGAEKDPERTRISGFSEFGLIEMTRKRDRESLARQLGEVCRSCDGVALLKSAQTVCYEMFRELKSRAHAERNAIAAVGEVSRLRQKYELRLHPELADRLNGYESEYFSSLLSALGVQVECKVEAQFDGLRFELIRV